jgi:UDP-N-acetylglucosamine 2-epimerase (non-hydrolysing)
MYDLYRTLEPSFTPREARRKLGLEKGSYLMATIHRDFNTDNPQALRGILQGLQAVAASRGCQVVLPLHPRTRKCIAAQGLESLAASLTLIDPLGYLDLMALTQDCAGVVTDSGGYQKEAYYAGKRAVVIMPDTGWRELTECGWNILCPPQAPNLEKALAALEEPREYPRNLFGEGHAGERIVEELEKNLG